MTQKCPICEAGASGDFKAGSLSAILEAALERESLCDILVVLELLASDKLNIIKADLQDGANSPGLKRNWRTAASHLKGLAQWAAEKGL